MKNVIPCLFTSGNLSFGVLSMIMTLHGLYTWAGVCILLAMVCDACDGRSARALASPVILARNSIPCPMSYPSGRLQPF